MSESEKNRMVFKRMNYLIIDHGLMAHLEISEDVSSDYESVTILINSNGMGFGIRFVNNYGDRLYCEELYISILGTTTHLIDLYEPSEIVSRILDQIELATISADLVVGDHDEQ